jgi:hypothetical protein
VVALLDILLVLFILVVPAVGLCTQVIPLHLHGVIFRDTDLDHAWRIVGQYAEGTFEQRFGYPTGYFYLDEKRSREPSRILMREAQPAGAVTDGCSWQIGSVGMSGFSEGCGAGCLTLAAASMIGAPFWIVSTFDRIYRLILRSRVDVQLVASGPDTVATFAFYGPGGYSLRSRYAQVFEKPALPDTLSLVAVPATGQPAEAAA